MLSVFVRGIIRLAHVLTILLALSTTVRSIKPTVVLK